MDCPMTPPSLTSLNDLTIIEAWDVETDKPKYVIFYLVTPQDERLFFGQSPKNRRDITLAEFGSALEHVPDAEVFPEVPKGITLTIAPDVDDASVFIKRPELACYDHWKGTQFVSRAVLGETTIMEQVSKAQHPNIIRYLGCRVNRGRVTGIVLERLDQTLTQYVETSRAAFDRLDKVQFFEGLKSAVDHLHSLGLAHNDINPYNIMIKDGRIPVLIDFGSCQPFGGNLQSLGTEGWYETEFFTSEKKHDEYSLEKLREWLQKPW